MANTIFKASLQAAKFPPRYSQAKRGVVNTGSDQSPRIPVSFVGTSESLDYNMIELQYSQNTLPTDFGVTSFGVAERLPSIQRSGGNTVPDTTAFYLPPISEDAQATKGDWSNNRRFVDFRDGAVLSTSGGKFPGGVIELPGETVAGTSYVLGAAGTPAFDFSADFEISLWVKIDSFLPGEPNSICCLYPNWSLEFSSPGGFLQLDGFGFVITGSSTPALGEWHFIRWCCISGIHYIFLNERLEAQTGPGPVGSITMTNLHWGRQEVGFKPFNGKMQDLYVDTGGVYSSSPISIPTTQRLFKNIGYEPLLVPSHVKYMAHLETDLMDSSQSKLEAVKSSSTYFSATGAAVGLRGLTFTGNITTDGLSIPYATLPWADSFWISFKGKVTSLANQRCLMCLGSTVAALIVQTTGQLAWWENTTQVALSTLGVSLNTFFEIGIAHDGAGTYTVYLDGAVALVFANGTPYVPTDWQFGKRGNSNALVGSIDEIYFSTEFEHTGPYTPSNEPRFRPSPVEAVVEDLLVLRTSLNRLRLYVPDAGANWLFDSSTNSWKSVPVPELTEQILAGVSQITSAPVAGGALVCFSQTAIIRVSAAGLSTEQVDIQWPEGISISQVRGICWALNYLIAWTSDQILWSTPLDPFNFSDTAQGAGSATPLDLKGAITVCQPIAGGLIIYTGKNAVGATYTENAVQPFRYKEIRNSGGCVRVQHLTGDYNGGLHYTYGPTGFQKVTLSEAVTVFPELSDALAQPVVQAWNETTSRVEEFSIPGAVEVSMDFLANRYLCISAEVVGDGFKYMSYIYDTVLERWGTLVRPHIRMFMLPDLETATDLQYNELIGSYASLTASYNQLNAEIESATPGRASLACMSVNGSVQVLDFNEPGDSVVIYGRAQLLRSQAILLNWVELDGISDNTTVTALSSSTGHSRDGNLELSKISDYEGYGKYAGRIGGINLDFAVKGKFALSSLIVNAQSHGRVRVIADVAAPPPPI